MITDYATLQTEVADWLNRADLTSQIPTFIQLAEVGFNRVLRVNDMIERDTSVISNGYVNMPLDWLETITLITTASPPVALEYVRIADMNAVRATERSGDPIVYTIINNKFMVYPAPGSDLSVELVYYAQIPSLSDENTANWLLTRHPDFYLYGALLQAEPYLKNDERLAVWASMYKGVLDAITLESEGAKRPEGGIHARKRTFG